jgi:hypothetical protein
MGDLFIVGWLYYLFVFFFTKLRPSITAVLVFTISIFVEISQAHLVSILSAVPNWILFWTGMTFDPLDLIICAVGVALAVITNLILITRESW